MRFVQANGARDSTSKDGSRRCSFLTSKNASPNSRGHQAKDSTGSRRQVVQVFRVLEYQHCFSPAGTQIKGGEFSSIRFLGPALPYSECFEPSLGLCILAYSGSKIAFRTRMLLMQWESISLKLEAEAPQRQASSPIIPRFMVISVRAWRYRPSPA